MKMANGGIRVTKPTTGAPHLIRDIMVSVPHRVSVYIPADKALNSKDLYRDLATGAIFQLSGFIKQDAPEGVEDEDDDETPAAPAKRAPEASVKGEDTASLKEGMARLERQLATLTTALQNLTVTQVVQATPGEAPKAKDAGAIDLNAPMFIPDNLIPKADVNIQAKEAVSNEGISNAASKLKELRRSKS